MNFKNLMKISPVEIEKAVCDAEIFGVGWIRMVKDSDKLKAERVHPEEIIRKNIVSTSMLSDSLDKATYKIWEYEEALKKQLPCFGNVDIVVGCVTCFHYGLCAAKNRSDREVPNVKKEKKE